MPLAEGRSVADRAARVDVGRDTARNRFAGAMAETGSRGRADLVGPFASGA